MTRARAGGSFRPANLVHRVHQQAPSLRLDHARQLALQLVAHKGRNGPGQFTAGRVAGEPSVAQQRVHLAFHKDGVVSQLTQCVGKVPFRLRDAGTLRSASRNGGGQRLRQTSGQGAGVRTFSSWLVALVPSK